MGLTLILAPSGEPIALAEAKLHCRVDSTEDDALITALIVAARNQAEDRTGRVLVTQKWRIDIDAFPVDTIEIPLPPLVSVESITYLDSDGTRQTLDAAEYQVVANETPGRVLPAYGKSWPGCRVAPGSVQISFTAGYGAAVSVPQAIKQWMLLQIGHGYANRESVNVGNVVNEMPYVDSLLDPYRVLRFC